MSGFSIVEVGNLHKVIPAAQKSTEPLPTFINVPADTLPDNDLTVRFVTILENIPVDQNLINLTQSMLPRS